MNKEELKAIEKLKWYYKDSQNLDVAICTNVVLNLIQKQESIIDKMAEQLAGLTIWNDNIQEPLILVDKEEVIEYFKKEVNNENTN